MYLSQVEIDINNRKKLKDLTHLGAYHNWVEQSFPDEVSKGERSRKLWRIDKLRGKEYLLLVSENKPDLEKIEKYGVTGSGQTKDYTQFLSGLETGMKARFKITLNPVMRKSAGTGNRGKIMPHVTVDQQKKYLLNRAEKNGFILNDGDFTITERGYEPLRGNGGKLIRISKAVYEGVLTISDVEVFRQTLTQGFGKKKAYGFGMMTVIPVSSDE